MDRLRSYFRPNFAETSPTFWQTKGNNKRGAVRFTSGHSRLIILLGIILIAGLWFYVRYQITTDYDRSVAEASMETMNLAIAYEEHVRRIVAEADKDLLNLKHAYEKDGIPSPVIEGFMQNWADDPARNKVAIFNEQGTLVLSSSAFSTSASDREYFQFPRSTIADTLYIDKPIQSRIGDQTVIPLTRRINKPDGSFGGIVFISLRASYFLDFYNKMNLGHDQVIALIGMDGFNRVRQSDDKLEIGQDYRGSILWKNIQTGSPYGSYITENIVDGIRRLVSYRVMVDYPLVVSVGKSTQVALAGYEQRKQGTILGALLVSLFILGFFGLLLDRVAKQRALHMELERRVDDRTQELQAAYASLRQLNATLEDMVNVRTQDLRDMNAALQEEIMERFKAEEHIREQARLLELAHDYIMVRDLDSKIIYWNQGAESGYGWTASEAIGQVEQLFLKTQFPVAEEDIMDRLLTEGRWEGELIHTRKDGKQITVQSFQTLNKDAAGNPVSILEINHEITEQKMYEAEIARLDRLNIIGEMAAGIGHEVRNPMTTVRGYLQNFARKPDFAEYRKSLALMIEELDRANGIITEFLGLAKNKAVILRPIDLNQVIHNLFPLLQADAFRRWSDIELQLQAIPEVLADEKEMRQCILNLVGNGLDAMPEGGMVTISTAKAEDRVIMTVQDRGTGIPPEIQGKLGTPFFTTKENGTGLGLAVCYRIAQQHQATIEVQTGPEGTAFHFIFKYDMDSAAKDCH